MASVWTCLKRNQFAAVALFLQFVFLVLFGVFVDYEKKPGQPRSDVRTEFFEANSSEPTNRDDKSVGEEQANEAKSGVVHSYAAFQDIHAMIFIGFGFLMVFLKRYSFSSVGLNMLVAALVLQWATLTGGWILHLEDGRIHIDVMTLIGSDFAAAAVLISFGAVLGKASPVQLMVLAVLEIVVFQLNEFIVFNVLKATDTGDSMVVHVFGAYFGLSVSLVLGCPDVEATKRNQGSVYHSDVFAMIGTVFLWIFWPSFNSVTAVDEGQSRAVINTYYALTASAVFTFAMSAIIGKSKFDMTHVQNATLAGGVAVGTMADMMIRPWGAILTGSLAAISSVLGFSFLTPLLTKKLRIHDTCGVHNLHGIPGIMSGLGAMIPTAFATEAVYGSNLYSLFPAMADGRTTQQQAAYQLAALLVSLAMAIAGGLITGVLLRLPIWNRPRNDEAFDDQFLWDLPSDSKPSYPDDKADIEQNEELSVCKASSGDA